MTWSIIGLYNFSNPRPYPTVQKCPKPKPKPNELVALINGAMVGLVAGAQLFE